MGSFGKRDHVSDAAPSDDDQAPEVPIPGIVVEEVLLRFARLPAAKCRYCKAPTGSSSDSKTHRRMRKSELMTMLEANVVWPAGLVVSASTRIGHRESLSTD